jgi:sugar phosphate isomerase/epimerase
MRLHGHDIAVCSWSLRPTDARDLLRRVRALGLNHVQLALTPLVELDEHQRESEIHFLIASGLSFTGGMINFPGEDYSTIAAIRETGGFVPDSTWPQRRELALRAAKLAAALKLHSITTHIGAVPQSHECSYQRVLDRVREIAAAFAADQLNLLLETGQETAAELRAFLNDAASPNLGVNFDPANMILYGAGDPIAAVALLGPTIRHVHLKDAISSDHPGITWGDEVPVGTGRIDLHRFLSALHSIGYAGPLAIEREAGDSRDEDVRTAIEAIQLISQEI